MVEHALATIASERAVRTPPYDPDDWERRVAIARAKREVVLRERAEVQAAPPELVAQADAHGEDALHLSGFAGPPKRVIPLCAPARSPAPPRRIWSPFLVGITIGSAVGTSLVGFAVLLTSPAQIVATAAAVPRAPVAAPVVTVHPVATPPATSASSTSARVGPVPIIGARILTHARGPALATPVPEHLPTIPAASPRPPSARSVAPATAALLARPADEGLLPHTGEGAIEAAPSTSAPFPMQSPALDAGVFAEIARQPVPPSATGRAAWANAPADGLSARVGVHLPAAYTSETRDRVLLPLAEFGWPMVEVATSYTIGQTHVRYYHAADREAAEVLAMRIGSTARDFTRFSPLPATGYVEIWLGSLEGAGSSNPVAASVPPSLEQGAFLGGGGVIAPASMPPGGVEGTEWQSRRLQAWRARVAHGPIVPAASLPDPANVAEGTVLDTSPRVDVFETLDFAARAWGATLQVLVGRLIR